MEIRALGQSLFDLFFPRRCLHCDSVIVQDTPLCVFCAADLSYTHWKLDKNNHAYSKLKELCKIKSAYSLLIYRHDNVTQTLLHHLKYENRPEIGELLAQKMIEEIDLKGFDGIIPIPIHPKKLKKRGYNQVIPFAKALAEHYKTPLIEDYLFRKENNKSQVTKSRNERLTGIKNAFAVKPKALKGRYIIVDDTLTTGATISTCVNLIRQNKDIELSVVTIACAY